MIKSDVIPLVVCIVIIIIAVFIASKLLDQFPEIASHRIDIVFVSVIIVVAAVATFGFSRVINLIVLGLKYLAHRPR